MRNKRGRFTSLKVNLYSWKNNLGELKKNYVEDFNYDKGVLCWHIATEICYNVDDDESDRYKNRSKILSNYLMYLMIRRLKLMAAVLVIGHKRYAGTCLEVKALDNKLAVENLKDFCTKVLEGRAKDDGAGHDHEQGEGGNIHEYDDERNNTENCGCGVENKSMIWRGS